MEDHDNILNNFIETQYNEKLDKKDLNIFIEILNENWKETKYILDDVLYKKIYFDIEKIFKEYNILKYFKNDKYDSIAMSLSFAFICHEINNKDNYDKIILDGILCIYMAILDDLNSNCCIDLKDIIYPFNDDIKSINYKEFIIQTRKLLNNLFLNIKSPWSDLIIDAHNLTYLSYYEEKYLKKKKISFYIYNYYRMRTIAIPYTNILKGYLNDNFDWYSYEIILMSKTFEINTTLLLGYVQDITSKKREEKMEEATNIFRLNQNFDSDYMLLIRKQINIVLESYKNLKIKYANTFIEFLYKQIKLMFAWYLITSRYFDKKTLLENNKILLELNIEIPINLIELKLL